MPAKLNTQEFISKAILKHGDLYDYSKVDYVTAHTKVGIICKTHGEFYQAAYSHLSGIGCPKCGIIFCSDSNKSNTQEFIDKAILIHGNKYDYSKVDYIGAIDKVSIICRDHGEFRQTPSVHINGHACPKCGSVSTRNKLKSNTQNFITKANLVHDNKYDYSKVNYINSKYEVIIFCKTHGEFNQSPNDHLDGCGCPSCSIRTSKSQRLISDYISSKGFEVIDNYKPEFMKRQHLDIFIPVLNVAIEYCGAVYHHSSINGPFTPKPKSYHYDKWVLCKQNNVTLLNIFDFNFEPNRNRYYRSLDRLLFGDRETSPLDTQEIYTGENLQLEYFWVKPKGSKFIVFTRKQTENGNVYRLFPDSPLEDSEQVIMRSHGFLQVYTSRLINFNF
jgi:Zn finger protein HypA/HybF involved in hydrogenase expression